MFLPVSGTVSSVNMSKEQREDFAKRLEMIRLQRYGGSRLAAYSDAKVNSATWTRAETAQTIKETSVIAIVSRLWPDTAGDWRRIVPPIGGVQAVDPESNPEIADRIREVESWDLPENIKQPVIEALIQQAKDVSEVKGA